EKRWAAVFALVAACLAGVSLSRSIGAGAPAQSQLPDRPPRIAVVSIQRVKRDILENKDLDARLKSEGLKLQAENKEREDEIKRLDDQRGNFRTDSPQYEEAQKQYI